MRVFRRTIVLRTNGVDGCAQNTKGGKFIPGHDAKLVSALIESVGGIEGLRAIIEGHVGHRVVPEMD